MASCMLYILFNLLRRKQKWRYVQEGGLKASQALLKQIHELGFVVGDTKASNFMTRCSTSRQCHLRDKSTCLQGSRRIVLFGS